MVALLDATGGRRETIRYSAYGVPFGIAASDVDGSGAVDGSDASAITTALGDSLGDPDYTVVADINLDGTVDASDSAIESAQNGYTLGHGALSRSPSLSGGVGNRISYAGYAWEPVSSKYHVRNRVLDPLRGRWSRRDPLGYVDAPTLFAYVSNRAMSAGDPSGLRRIQPVEPPAKRLETAVRPVCPEVQEFSEEPSHNGCASGGGGSSASGIPPYFTPDTGFPWWHHPDAPSKLKSEACQVKCDLVFSEWQNGCNSCTTGYLDCIATARIALDVCLNKCDKSTKYHDSQPGDDMWRGMDQTLDACGSSQSGGVVSPIPPISPPQPNYFPPGY